MSRWAGRLIAVIVLSLSAAGPMRAQRAAPMRFVPHAVPLYASTSALTGQVRVAQPRRAGPVRRGIVMGSVFGGGLMITWLILEDMLGGELLMKDNAKGGITPGRIVTYTAIGAGTGALIGGTIGYLYKRRSQPAARTTLSAPQHFPTPSLP